MNKEEVMQALQEKSDPTIKRIFLNHGAPESILGVRIQDLKVIQKKIRKQQQLALELYDTGISDAMYLAGLVADGRAMTRAQLEKWARQAPWQMISEYTVPWVTSENKDAVEMAQEWIQSQNELIAVSGWATLSSVAGIRPDDQLDLGLYQELLESVPDRIHNSPNYVRYTMNAFVIATGCYIRPLMPQALEVAARTGKVSVNMGNTACKVPAAVEYIHKAEKMGRIGRKRKDPRC